MPASATERIPVDTGFIVYNERNYPLFSALLRELGVQTQEGDMSFSLSCRVTGLEYSGSSLNTLFAQRRNLLRPSFYGMLREIMRLNSLSEELLQAPPEESLADFLASHDLSGPVVDDYLAPMAAAIWSSDPAEILDFPAAYFGHFFHNHGLLSVNDRPQWRTICGGSRSYIAPLTRSFRDSRSPQHTRQPRGAPSRWCARAGWRSAGGALRLGGVCLPQRSGADDAGRPHTGRAGNTRRYPVPGQ